MPATRFGEDYKFLDRSERLSFEEIERVCRHAARLGVSKIRLTGGEPLLRRDLPSLIGRLRDIDGIRDIALTTNGALLSAHAAALRDAGLTRVTVSLDAIEDSAFQRMTGGRGNLAVVLNSISTAIKIGFPGGVKINTVVQRDLNDDQVLPIISHFRHSGVVVRFIEFMDVGTRNGWAATAVVPTEELLQRVGAAWEIEHIPKAYPGEVADNYRLRDGSAELGFISSVSRPFCGGCSRARLSSDGKLVTCLFSDSGIDLKGPLRDQHLDDQQLEQLIRSAWLARKDRYSEVRSQAQRPTSRKIEMYYIGG